MNVKGNVLLTVQLNLKLITFLGLKKQERRYSRRASRDTRVENSRKRNRVCSARGRWNSCKLESIESRCIIEPGTEGKKKERKKEK